MTAITFEARIENILSTAQRDKVPSDQAAQYIDQILEPFKQLGRESSLTDCFDEADVLAI